MHDIDVIIVNYGTPALTQEAVLSVLAAAETARVLIVDNHSPDGSASLLERAFADRAVRVVPLLENRGFGGACNAGAGCATAPYLFLLNSDAVARPDCLAVLRRRLETTPDVGIVAPAVYLTAGDVLQADALGRFPTALSILLRRTRRPPTGLEPDWVSGVALLVRRSEFLALGGFDPAFFMYYEDVDLCRRYRARGLRVVREPAAAVLHRGGASQQSSAAQKAAYDHAQDVYLERIGTPPALRRLVRHARQGARFVFAARPPRSGP